MYNKIKVKVVCMKRLLRVGLLFSMMGLCFWVCFNYCTAQVMAAGIPYSTYGANGIYFYSPCTTVGDDYYGDGTSFKIDPNASPADFWFYEQDWNNQSDPTTTTKQEVVMRDTRIDKDFGYMPYIYADNYDIQYTPWPPKFIPNGGNSKRKYYWITLPDKAFVKNMGDKYVAYFEKREEPVFFITYDVWACEHQPPKGVYYCRDAENDPDNVVLGKYKNSVLGYASAGDGRRNGYSVVNEDLIPSLGRLTCLHRISTFDTPDAHETGSCSGSINISSSTGSKKEEKDAEKKDEEETDEEETDKEETNEEKTDDEKPEEKASPSDNEEAKTASSDTKLHKPENEWLDNAGLEGFKILKATNSAVPYGAIDTAAIRAGTNDSYASYASDAGNGTGLPGFIVLHWTASGGVSGDYHWSIFGDGESKIYPPHFAIDVVQKKIWQYFPLSSPSGAVQVWDPYGVQIEVVGWPDNTAGSEYNIYNFTEDQYEYLAKLLIAISDETGIPLESSLKWTKGQEQGEETAPKLSAEEVRAYIGVLGHEHLPDQAGKWDPGKMWDFLVPALERLGYKYNANGGGRVVCAGDRRKSCGGDRIAEVAKELAWPDDKHHNDIKPEFAKAATDVGISSAASNWDGWAGGAADCGRFVAVVVKKAVDSDYPNCCTGPIQQYMSSSSSWEEIPNKNSEDNMKPGDVMVVNGGSGVGASGHIYIYLGNGEQASASLNGYTGKIKQGVTFADSRGTYHIFRYVGDTDCGGSNGETKVASFDGEMKELEKDGVKVGVAVSAPGNKQISEVKTAGSWNGGRAWSTIKVPLSIAAIQENVSTGEVTEPYGTSCNPPSLSSAVYDAITQSDNCAAWWLWEALGGDGSSTADKVTKILRAGGDSSTTVNGTRNDGKYLTSGKTNWSLADQVIFAANMSSIDGSSEVLSKMIIHNASDGSHGLASNYTSMVKGGWGDADGAATRQFGLVKLKNGECSAVAIGTNQGSNFSMLDKIVKILLNHEDDLPAGKCPEGL